jgi:hypothetical protein
MTDDQRSIQLKQLANIVIDAYLNRSGQFTPEFKPGTRARLCGSRPKGDKDHPDLRTGIWYEQSDYEPKV